jgi:hypothetical protein
MRSESTASLRDFITREDAAEMLGKSTRSVDRYIKQGKLNKYQRGRYWVRVKVDEVQALKTELTEVVAVAAK